MNKFQTILLIVFGIGAVFAVMVFAGYIPKPTSKSSFQGSGTVVVWGTIDDQQFVSYMNDLSDSIQNFRLRYVPKDPNTYEAELIEAFAAGKGPDLFFVDNENMLRFSSQIQPISYSVLPQKNFLETYAPAFSVFLANNGILAYPFLIDPMVLYYNKTLLVNDGIANPPKYWDEISSLTENLTKRDTTGAFLQSTISMGRFENNIHAKNILILLLTQVGNNIVTLNKEGQYVSDLATHRTSIGASLPAVVTYFTDFASPDTLVYSWNKSLPDATSSFLVERVALYPGFSSELFNLQQKNPNLALAVTDIPQPRGFTNKKTYAKVTGIALSKYSANKETAILSIQTIASPYHGAQLAKTLSLPSAFASDLKANPDPSLAYQSVLQVAALRAVSFRDPNTTQTNSLFRELTQNILAGGADADGAYDRADANLSFILNRLNQSNVNSINSTDVVVPTRN
jgi:ABC-type glycerol-3-phosphate transport system substrate-binding protein